LAGYISFSFLKIERLAKMIKNDKKKHSMFEEETNNQTDKTNKQKQSNKNINKKLLNFLVLNVI
jgi:hypothetical protein